MKTLPICSIFILATLLTSCINPEAEVELRVDLKSVKKEVKVLRSELRELRNELTEFEKYVNTHRLPSEQSGFAANKASTTSNEELTHEDTFINDNPELIKKLNQRTHTLTSRDGKQIIAQILNVTDTHVSLLRDNGRKYTFKLERLTNEDQIFLTEWKRHKGYLNKAESPSEATDSTKEMDAMFDSLFDSK